ncbi:MAG: hypothetical protein PVH65_12170, partial [Chloroflexota bacterium]
MNHKLFGRFSLRGPVFAILFALGLALSFTVTVVATASAFQASDPGVKTQPASPRQAATDVEAVWQRLRDAGAYSFQADIAQKEIPLATAANVGRTSKTSRFYMEGDADPGAGTMNLTLWGSGGSVLDTGSGISVRVDGDRVEARQGQSGEWQAVDNFGALFAPEGNFATFLVAAREVTAHPEANGTTRYAFSVDGPRFAAYMRDQIRDQMIADGELLPNMTLELPKLYADMTGQGQLWVGPDGLPLRQEIHLNLPEEASTQEGTRLEIDSAVTFAGFEQDTAAAPALFEATGSAGARELAAATEALADSTTRALPSVAATLIVLVVLLALLRHSHSRPVYAAFALGLVAMMVLTPVFQTVQVARAENKRLARQQATEARQQQSEMMQTVQTLQDEARQGSLPDGALALIRNDDGADSDGDGISDVAERLQGNWAGQDGQASVALEPGGEVNPLFVD